MLHCIPLGSFVLALLVNSAILNRLKIEKAASHDTQFSRAYCYLV